MSEKLVFTPDEVVALADYQVGRRGHPFTCEYRGDGNHRVAFGDKGALVPTVRGWICPFCDYTQDWAHPHMKGHRPAEIDKSGPEWAAFLPWASLTTKEPE